MFIIKSACKKIRQIYNTYNIWITILTNNDNHSILIDIVTWFTTSISLVVLDRFVVEALVLLRIGESVGTIVGKEVVGEDVVGDTVDWWVCPGSNGYRVGKSVVGEYVVGS